MSDLITVNGVVLSSMPVGDYDKRVVLLTKERGKITAFAKGARRQNSALLAATNPFVFGTFSMYEGRSSYNLTQAAASHYFVELAKVQPGVYYGFYFLEVADYYGREYTDEREMMNLLYVSLKALLHPKIENDLVRRTFEFRTLVIQGEYPQIYQCNSCDKEEELTFFSQRAHGLLCGGCARQYPDARRISPASVYALRYMAGAPLEKLYRFTVKEEVLAELDQVIGTYFRDHTDKRFKSLQILEQMC
ncbi:MAG: DNA repair protein RecO [Blautia sp.]